MIDLIIQSWDEVDVLASDPGLHVPAERKDDFEQLVRFLRFRQAFDALPVAIRLSERPDFVASALSTGITTGIEVTWAANQGWEEAQAYLGATKNPGFVRASRNLVEHIRKRGKALGRHLEARQSDSPIWSSHDHAAAKAREVANAIQKKSGSFSELKYQKFNQNWLLITDRSPFLFLEVNEFFESVYDLVSWEIIQYDALYFVTQLRNRTRREEEDVLCQLSRRHCQVIGSCA